MIRFERVPEPDDFDRLARQPGLAWLAAHPDADRPKDYWSPFKPHLADDEILDPHEVDDGWFEILLPSLQLVLTDAVPPERRAQAEHTLRRLHLRDDERILRQRRAWYQLYQEGKLTIEGLHERAPLLARAIRKAEG